MAKRVRTSRHALGYALLADDVDTIAAVFFDRAVDLERGNLVTHSGHPARHDGARNRAPPAGVNHHSDPGVLRATWGDWDLEVIAQGQMCFTSGEARRMVSMISRRNEVRRN
jgi:hypothetical protein